MSATLEARSDRPDPTDPLASVALSTASVASVPSVAGVGAEWIPAVIWAGPPPMGGPVQDDPLREYLGVPTPFAERTLAQLVDELTQAVGPRVYDAMMADPVIRASVTALRAGAIADGPMLASRYPVADGSDFDPDDPPEGATEDQVEAKRALDFCRWVDGGLATPIDQVAFQLSACFAYQSKLAEKLFDYRDDPSGKARLVPVDIRVKAWWQWWFIVDRYNHVHDIMFRDAQSMASYQRVAPDKFVVASYLSDDDSPQGQSGLMACHTWWKLKYQVPASAARFARLFSIPIPVIVLGQIAAAAMPRDSTGRPIPGQAEQSPFELAANAAKALMAGNGAVLPHGSTIDFLESKENVDPFTKLVDLCDRQNVHGITGSARTSLEARNGSKADAEASQDVGFDLMKIILRGAVARALRRDHYRDALARNFGEAYADRYCPTVAFGTTAKQDASKVGTVVAALVTAGVIRPSQYQAVLKTVLGWDLPEPADEDIEEASQPGEGTGADPDADAEDAGGGGENGPAGE